MTIPTQELDHKIATTDFELFYIAWEPKVRIAVYQAGFAGDDLEDLVQDIFLDLFKGGYLNKFDPQIATFNTYIWSHVKCRILGRKRDLWRRGQREVITDLTDPIYDPPVIDANLESSELTIALHQVYEELQELPSTQTKNLARLFQDIVEQIQTTGVINQQSIADKYGYSRQAISYQIASLAKTDAAIRLREEVLVG